MPRLPATHVVRDINTKTRATVRIWYTHQVSTHMSQLRRPAKTRLKVEGEGEIEVEVEVYTEPSFGDGDAIHPQCWYVDVINETYLGASA